MPTQAPAPELKLPRRIRLGILQVNHDKSEAVGDRFPDDAHRFRDLFDQFDDVRFTYRVYMTIGGELPQSLDEQDAFLITGSPLSVLDDHDWLPGLYDFIRACDKARKPLIGCCFGHQAIAVALGGTVERVDAGWNVGVETTQFDRDEVFMDDQRDLNFFVFHQDQVTRLPSPSRLLGSSQKCENASFARGEHILTTQMHPEFTVPFMTAVTDHSKASLGADTHHQARESLSRPTDGAVFARWIINFISAKLR